MSDHPEYRALVAGVRADPADDRRRLVAADWLDDHGAFGRADFIRLQVERAVADPGRCGRDPGYEYPPEYWGDGTSDGWRPRCRCRPCRLRREQGRLADRHGSDWRAGVLAAAHADYRAEVRALARGGQVVRTGGRWCWLFARDVVGWRRGFVWRVRLPAAAWERYADDLVAREPIEQVAVVGWTERPGSDWMHRRPGVWFETEGANWVPVGRAAKSGGR